MRILNLKFLPRKGVRKFFLLFREILVLSMPAFNLLWRLTRLVVVDTERQVLLVQDACSSPYNSSAVLRPLADAAREVTPLGVVLADAEFDSEQTIATCASGSGQ